MFSEPELELFWRKRFKIKAARAARDTSSHVHSGKADECSVFLSLDVCWFTSFKTLMFQIFPSVPPFLFLMPLSTAHSLSVLGTPLHFSCQLHLLAPLFLAESYIMVTLSLVFGATNNTCFRKQGYFDGRGEIKRWLSIATVKRIITVSGTVLTLVNVLIWAPYWFFEKPVQAYVQRLTHLHTHAHIHTHRLHMIIHHFLNWTQQRQQ